MLLKGSLVVHDTKKSAHCSACRTQFKADTRAELDEQFKKHQNDGTCNVQTRDFPPKAPTK